MPSYTLNIDFSAADLGTLLSAGEHVVITKIVNGSAGASVAWLTFSPQAQNTVNWSEDYTLYATTSGEHAASPQVLEWQSGQALPWPVAGTGEQSLEGELGAVNATGLSFALQSRVDGETVLIPLQGPVVPAERSSGSLSWQPDAGHFVLTMAE
ncbi:hypothetical protein [Leeia aquatica]|uniref:Uncharacterized protein n=1 Tax=Leeia aquatica TaxID=2725557 RepID=A0A847S529_9NEIS|nr:hypothetical protein [Leeia aquatica]NLR74227.1 hypothetical protein [Leeia aquatica]